MSSYYCLVQRMGAVQASTVPYVPPVVALVIGLFAAALDGIWAR